MGFGEFFGGGPSSIVYVGWSSRLQMDLNAYPYISIYHSYHDGRACKLPQDAVILLLLIRMSLNMESKPPGELSIEEATPKYTWGPPVLWATWLGKVVGMHLFTSKLLT